MKIKKETAIAFLLALGFKTAEEWDNEKTVSRLAEVPSRLTIEAVPNKFHAVYNEITAAVKEKKTITLIDEEADTKAKKPAPKAKADKAADKAPAKAKAEKPKKEKKEKAPKKERERDAFGAALGTVRANINAKLSKEWQSDADVAKAAGVTLRQARLHCRRMVRQGKMEKVRTIAYRLIPAKKSDAKA